MKYLRLIRIQNLLFIAASMYCMRYFVLQPILGEYGYQLASSEIQFGMMVVSVLFITAAASIINDYFDRKADFMNRPDRVIVGAKVDRRLAIILHSVLNVIGVFAGFYVTISAGHFWHGFIFIFISAIFWLYSARFKKKFLFGNIIISLLIAGITFLPWLTEFIFAKSVTTTTFPEKTYHHLMIISLGFSFAGFLLNLVREVMKAYINFRGDYQSGYKTLPVVMGKTIAKNTISILLTTTSLLLITAWFTYIRNISSIQYPTISFSYLIFLLIVPMIVLATHIPRIKKKNQMKTAGIVIKLVMMFGILYSLVFYLNIIL